MKQLPVETLHPYMKVLSGKQARGLHNTVLEIMASGGMKVLDEEAVQLFRDAGAEVEKDNDGHWVKLPEFMLQDALNSAPSRVVLCDQKGHRCLFLEEGKTYFGTGSDTIYTLDPETGERRRVIIHDIENFARLCDYLPNISFVMSMGNPEDVPQEEVYVYEFARLVKNTGKPVVFCSRDENDLERIWEIAAAVYGGDGKKLEQNPFLLTYIEPLSPLTFPRNSARKVIAAARHGIPLSFPSGANTGGGAPVTMAGALAMGITECLYGLVLQQLAGKGAPFVFGPNVSSMDLKTSVVSYGSPEWSLAQGAVAEMGSFYGLPTWAYAGATDAKKIDAQAGAEAAFSIYSALACRCNLVHDAGYIEYGSTSSLEQVVLADELIDKTRFFMQGIEINDNTLALDVLPHSRYQSSFLTDDHTLKNFRSAQWYPGVMNRQNYTAWEKAGRPGLEEKLRARVREILSAHRPEPKPPGVEEKIDSILGAGG